MRIFGSSAIAPAIAAALGAGLVYSFIAGMVDPYSQHLGAAFVIGATLGIHVYRRARVRLAGEAHRQQQIST